MFSRLLLTILGILAALFVLEVLLRFVILGQDNFYEPHPLYGWHHKQSFAGWNTQFGEFQVKVETNSHGLREDTEYLNEKSGDTFRILVLGDSFAEAFQVTQENTFVKRLKTMLNQSHNNTAKRYEVINAGVGNWSTQNELLYFENEGYRLQPDLVLLMFYPSNDVVDNDHAFPASAGRPEPYYALNNGELVLKNFPLEDIKSSGGSPRIRSWLAKHSRLALVVWSTAKRTTFVRGYLERAGIIATVPPLPLMEIYRPQYIPELDETWSLTAALINRLDNTAIRHDARLGVVIVTDPGQVYDQWWDATIRGFPELQGTNWDKEKPNRVLSEILERQEIPYLDLLPIFQKNQGHSERLHLLGDGHWSPAGHQLTAESILEWLKERNLAPLSAQ